MDTWHEEEAKAECIDLRIRARQQDAQIARLTRKLAEAKDRERGYREMAKLLLDLADSREESEKIRAEYGLDFKREDIEK